MKKEDDFENLIQIIHNQKDKRISILLLFLYAEYYINQLLKKHKIKKTHPIKCKHCNQITNTRQLSISEKISLLITNKIIDKDIIEPINLLNDIRNRLIHDIYPNNEKIEEWINAYSPPTEKALKKLLKKEKPWLKFTLCLLPAIANLYEKLNNHKPINSIQINTSTGDWIIITNPTPHP
jgi:hypothetical protein